MAEEIAVMTVPRFVLIDNDPYTIDIITTSLSDYNIQLEVIQKGKQSIQKVRSNVPALILLSPEVSPYGGGYKVFSKLRKLKGIEEIPIILLPSKAVERNFDPQGKYKDQAAGYLYKPVGNHKLIDLLKGLVDLVLRDDTQEGFLSGEGSFGNNNTTQRADGVKSMEFSGVERGSVEKVAGTARIGYEGEKALPLVKERMSIGEGDIVSEEYLIGEDEIESIELLEDDVKFVDSAPVISSDKPFADLLIEAASAMDEAERGAGPIAVEGAFNLSKNRADSLLSRTSGGVEEAVTEAAAREAPDLAVKDAAPSPFVEMLLDIERGELTFEAKMVLDAARAEGLVREDTPGSGENELGQLKGRIERLEQALEAQQKENADYQRQLRELTDRYILELEELNMSNAVLEESVMKKVAKAADILSSILPAEKKTGL